MLFFCFLLHQDDPDRNLFARPVGVGAHEHEGVLADEARAGLPHEHAAFGVDPGTDRQRPKLVTHDRVAEVGPVASSTSVLFMRT